MNVLVINCGSSSVKFKVINSVSRDVLVKGHVDGIGLDSCVLKLNGSETKLFVDTHESALKEIFKVVDVNVIDCVGHRVVHGGQKYVDSVIIDDDVVKAIGDLCDLAPLHNPANLQGIKACMSLLKGKKQVAVFDTSFHQSMAKDAFLYGVPLELYESFSVRKYGFHGISHSYLYGEVKRVLGRDINVISCHLGNGASVACINQGRVVDTSMGFTPLDGLVMGTRSGGVDPGLLIYLQKIKDLGPDELCDFLNKESGLKGICGFSDVRVIHEKAELGDERCGLALDVFVWRLKHFIGAYLGLMRDRTDVLVFSAGIGEGAFYLRKKVCDELSHLGFWLDDDKNNRHDLFISKDDSPIKIMVVPTDEELMIALEALKLVKSTS
ncbi:acetate kinase [Candidatus Woesearchaeota archaeon]|nr:acetate kinase [Candidatus Woesearchaeota archaeon]